MATVSLHTAAEAVIAAVAAHVGAAGAEEAAAVVCVVPALDIDVAVEPFA